MLSIFSCVCGHLYVFFGEMSFSKSWEVGIDTYITIDTIYTIDNEWERGKKKKGTAWSLIYDLSHK